MKFAYVGDKIIMQAFGYDFSGGKTPDVTDANAIKRLLTNPHFECVEPLTTAEESGAGEDDFPSPPKKAKNKTFGAKA